MVDIKQDEAKVKADAQKVASVVTGAVSAAKADVAASQGWLSQHKGVVIAAVVGLLIVVVAVWLA